MCLERLQEAKEDYEQVERTLAIKVGRFYRQGFKMGPFMLRCKYLEEQRSRKERLMIDRVDGWNELGGDCDG